MYGAPDWAGGDLEDLQSPVCDTPVSDIIHDHFAGFMQYLVNDPLIHGPDPVQRFRTGKFLHIVRERIV
jgi:hypothetical protein